MLLVVGIIVLLTVLLGAWAFSARRNWQKNATQVEMGVLVGTADTLKQSSTIPPDHRLANFFCITLHGNPAPTTYPPGGQYRLMSSGEFFTFIASRMPGTDTSVRGLGDKLQYSQVPAAWNAPLTNGGVLVDVYQAYPTFPDPLGKLIAYKAGRPVVYAQVSDSAGYLLCAPVDAWGNPLVYRLYTFAGDLNQGDLDPGQTPAANSGSIAPTMEYIVQDEQFARDRYVSLGVASVPLAASGSITVTPSAPAASGTAQEIVRQAVGAHGYPQWISAGPDGKWGALTAGAAPDFTRDARTDAREARDEDARDNLYSQEMNQ